MASGAGQLRIIGGQFKRSKLAVAAVPGLRPSPERLRETLFNWLGGDLRGWHCLDAFAGTGALGLEAASRGAARVYFHEVAAPALAQLRKNADLLRSRSAELPLDLRLSGQDVRQQLRQWSGPPLDVVFLDPPFDQDALYAEVLALLPACLRPDAWVYLEAPKAWSAANLQDLGWQLLKHSRVGAVHGHLLQQLPVAG